MGIFIMENQEIWKDIEGYEGLYKISNFGRINSIGKDKKNNKKRIPYQKYLKCKLNKNNGYYIVSLSKKGIVKTFTVHRLLALAFIPNPENKPEVNHKDGIKTNTYESNLEWCTKSENALHCWSIGLNTPANLGMKGSKCPRSKKVYQYTKDMIIVNSFDAILEAERITGISHGNISMCACGKRKSANGYIWRYEKLIT